MNALRRSNVTLAIPMAAAGCALLLLRPTIPTANARPVLLAGIYLVLALGSLGAVVAGPSSERVVHPALALGVGIAAVIAAASASGTPIPGPRSEWAIPLGVAAAVAEEAFFRRFLYGHLVRYGAAVAVIGSALAFAAVHVPVYGLVALPVDLGAGLLFGWPRWASGSWAVPAATHAAANVLAVLA